MIQQTLDGAEDDKAKQSLLDVLVTESSEGFKLAFRKVLIPIQVKGMWTNGKPAEDIDGQNPARPPTNGLDITIDRLFAA